MIIEEIRNNYAVEQGFYDWNDLINSFIMFNLEENDNGRSLKWFNNHERAVDQLIQDELKKKQERVLDGDYDDLDDLISNILNTENIK